MTLKDRVRDVLFQILMLYCLYKYLFIKYIYIYIYKYPYIKYIYIFIYKASNTSLLYSFSILFVLFVLYNKKTTLLHVLC